jgi:putative hemolysin
MTMALTLPTLLSMLPPLVMTQAFFAGSEIALLSVDKLALKQQARSGARGAKLALELATHPERILSACLLMTNFCVVGIAGLTSLYFVESRAENSELLATIVASPLVVLFGELLPKTIFQRNAISLARWVAHPVQWTYWAFFPVTRLLRGYTSKLSSIAGPIEELLTGRRRTTRDDLETLLTYGRRESELKATERQMIKRILEFRETEARHALIPLVRVDAIEETATLRDALESFERHRHSRMPVYSERIDNIIGILETADLFMATDLDQPIRHYLTNPHYVAETQSLRSLLEEMHREDNEMVIVVDEHGGAVGILTFEDIVEEIVGEISDEFDVETAPYKELSEDSWLVQARMEVPHANEQLGIQLPEGEYETVGGFLLQQFGRIPETRDELFFNTPAGQLKFTIRQATERHIQSVLVERLTESEE